MKPDTVPERLENPIDYKLIALIIGITISIQFFITLIPSEEDADNLVSIISIINPLAASTVSFIVAHRYKGTQVFGRAYLSLGIAFLMVGLAEITYVIYETFLGLDPYPSIADVFFFLLYPFTLIHLILNIRFFKPKIDSITKVWMTLIPIAIFSIYVFSSFEEFGEANFDFYYGNIFIVGSSITLTVAILGARVFRQGILGKAWLLLVIGIFFTTTGDVWYYYLEVFELYDLYHPVNVFWYASYWIIVYALIKHKEIF